MHDGGAVGVALVLLVAAVALAAGAIGAVLVAMAPPPGSADGVAVQLAVTAAITRGADENVFPAYRGRRVVWQLQPGGRWGAGPHTSWRIVPAHHALVLLGRGRAAASLPHNELNVTLENISIDYAAVPYLQATIVGAVTVNSSFAVHKTSCSPGLPPLAPGQQAVRGASGERARWCGPRMCLRSCRLWARYSTLPAPTCSRT